MLLLLPAKFQFKKILTAKISDNYAPHTSHNLLNDVWNFENVQ